MENRENPADAKRKKATVLGVRCVGCAHPDAAREEEEENKGTLGLTGHLAAVHLEAQGDAGLPGNGADADEAGERALGEVRHLHVGGVGVPLENLGRAQRRV